MTDDELAAIAARANAATEGPWVERSVDDGVRPRVFVTREIGVPSPPAFYIAFTPEAPDSWANATFIAHARTDVPRLLDEIRRLKEARAAAIYRIGDLIAALNDYGEHTALCELKQSHGHPCTCGLDAAIRGAAPTGGEKEA